jgi:acyl-coenzyme A synthetase/AMP-(fatty) acid ligase
MTSIRGLLRGGPAPSGRFLWGATGSFALTDLLCGTSLGGRLEELAGRSVLIATRDPLAAALALVELDGVARRLVVGTPDLAPEHLPALVQKASVDAVVSDHDSPVAGELVPVRIPCGPALRPADRRPVGRRATEWVLLTSGTTGVPRLLVHSLAGLTAAIQGRPHPDPGVVWGTFYDIRRYGGLQILLRALLGRGSLVLSGAGESTIAYLARLRAHGATHLSGTPSHWRRVLMSRAARTIAPHYVRLSGEIADQAILDALRSFYPQARVAHAFASTEAGVGFEVDDGLEGFPAGLVGAPGEVERKVVDGSLRIRSARTATRYLGEDDASLADRDGFVDTGDMVERRGDRYYFLGRRSGAINVGGLKVYPEEVEAVINRHPAVSMSLVRSRRSPILGSLVAADVVLRPDRASSSERHGGVKHEILQICRESLAAHKVPATIRFVPALEVAAAGKLARRLA